MPCIVRLVSSKCAFLTRLGELQTYQILSTMFFHRQLQLTTTIAARPSRRPSRRQPVHRLQSPLLLVQLIYCYVLPCSMLCACRLLSDRALLYLYFDVPKLKNNPVIRNKKLGRLQSAGRHPPRGWLEEKKKRDRWVRLLDGVERKTSSGHGDRTRSSRIM